MRLLEKEKILIGPSSFSAVDSQPRDMLLKTGAMIIDNPYKRKLTKKELLKLLSEDITGIIAGLEPLDREVIANSRLKVISRCGSGMSNVDLKAAKELGIKVCSTPEAPVQAVAELTLGAMLNLLRMIPQMDKDLHEGKWIKRTGSQLEEKTVAIIGFGRIGRCVAKLLSPFKVRIVVVDPFLKEVPDNITSVPLEDALASADIIAIHSSGKDCVMGAREFAMIKKGAFLLNAARGDLIDEKTLITALKDGSVAGAWLDTFNQEPYNGPLREYPQVILTPHVGSYTKECRSRMEMEAVENLIQAF